MNHQIENEIRLLRELMSTIPREDTVSNVAKNIALEVRKLEAQIKMPDLSTTYTQVVNTKDC